MQRFNKCRFFKVISTYLRPNNLTISFDEMVKQFSYTQREVLEKRSNEYSKAQDLIGEFGLLLSEIEPNEIMLSEEQHLTFKHVLFFSTGMDHIPPYGFTKKIEVEFKDVSLPCANTCELHLTLHITNCWY